MEIVRGLFEGQETISNILDLQEPNLPPKLTEDTQKHLNQMFWVFWERCLKFPQDVAPKVFEQKTLSGARSILEEAVYELLLDLAKYDKLQAIGKEDRKKVKVTAKPPQVKSSP